ncbi:nucleolar protein 12-domain-containing protein [Cercophora newfieldiana]|uniref:Nucleolar protein 12-domain-containing protein n=1 Tax=Cercophora newfieldiana TaxID=92897 RepID=A0AA40CWZ5_9PEZI|nr:nucleolar protein 12-domain-containing protein [Cercophora newfieldiana]
MFAVPRVKKSTLQPPPKKRKTTHKIEEITFDRDARTEYLSGFRKRKQARIKEAKEIAAKKEREERIEMRKQIREERKQAIEEHVQTVTQILREAEKAGTEGQAEDGDSDSEEWNGLDDDVPEAPIDMEEEYIDEDRYTTVTVEAVSVDRDGLHKPGADSGDGADAESAVKDTKQHDDTESGSKKKEWPKKKKSFRYETKFERKITERKQKAKKGRR